MGVGIGNFAVHSPRYVDQVGPLERVDLIAEDLLVAHSFYLELLTETGVIGLGLFLLVVGGGLAACWRAARRLDQLGERSLAALALSIFVAIVGVLAGGVFVSGGQDERLWVLLGLGPAMLAVASRRAPSRTPERSPPVEAPPLREQPAPAMAGG
jgi:O-antigen ligase